MPLCLAPTLFASASPWNDTLGVVIAIGNVFHVGPNDRGL